MNVPLSIYTYDIDFAGHVGNVVYLQWLEMGRCNFLDEVGFPIHLALAQQCVPVIVRTNITYQSSLHLGDRACLEIWLSELKRVAHTLAFQFKRADGEVVASGSQRGTFLNPEMNRPRELPPAIRDLFTPYLSASC